ncbi:MAG: CCA tRNA nucleotidyltransferase [Lactobacillus sp.]|jgi:poly(A) polymerase|nr:CCA tRNA nucleotidyltransferase [Lactobacillus sp.]
MIRDNYLDVSKIIKDKKIMRLFRAVENHGGVLRFVGGCVRDALMGIEGFDIDLATDLSPEEMVEACEEKGLRTVPIGIKFGTVGVVIENNLLEVTSLRKDVSTDGRHAVVEFTTNWEIDASRRDLTINAVYADEKGNVFDYYNGIEDLEKGVVKFIGNPSARIKEDYLRILRFFRFYSIFSKTPIDPKALKACIENKDGLKKLSNERICVEFEKLLSTPKVVETVKIMMENGILDTILPKAEHLDKLDFLVNMTEATHLPNKSLRRLFALFYPNKELAVNLAARLKMSKKRKELFVNLASKQVNLDDFFDENKLRKIIYLHDKEFARDKFLLSLAYEKRHTTEYMDIIGKIENMVMPIFPIRGKDVIAAGVDPKTIGKTIDKLEQDWVDSNFSLNRDELLESLVS